MKTREILRIVWPLALGMVNNALLQFTDRAFLAHDSMACLEAVLPASMLAFVTLGFFQSIVAYSGVFVAQYHGAGDAANARQCRRAGTLLALASGAAMVAALPFGGWIFETFSNGAEVIALQKTYYDICTAGGVFLFGQMAVQAYFTGLGRTRIVLWVNLIGNALNVALDPLLIFGLCGLPRLGIAGAAYATVAATAVQWLILALAPLPAPTGAGAHAGAAERKPIPLAALCLRILRYGVPSGAYSVLNAVSFTVFVFFTGAVGHVEAAVSNAVMSVCYLLFAPMEGFALGAQTLVGQARGRGDDAGAVEAGLKTAGLGVAFVACASAAALVFREPILALYAPPDPADAAAFMSLGSTLFCLMAAWQIFDATDVIVSGALKGAGDTAFVMWWMLVCAILFWMPLVWLVSRLSNTMPALWATMIAYVVVICIGSCVRWWRGKWKEIRLV